MIEVITGLPGASKTLYTIKHVKEWSERDNRPVFYAGINELSLPWELIEPTKWMDCPKGSIIVIDECQTIFRNRSINSQVPDYVAKLETHRHLGVDLVFITQHPMLIDPAIRRLTQTHKHIIRIWGMTASTIHRWDGIRDNCDKPAAKKDSEKTKWVFDKSIYNYYKSAELHTGKAKLPKALIWLVAAPLAIIIAGFVVANLLVKKPVLDTPIQAKQTGVGSIQGNQAQPQKRIDPVDDAKDYIFKNTPRITNISYTAPKFDELTKPTSVPVPAACISSSRGCNCFTQQGTRLDVEPKICNDIVAHGYFQEFEADRRHNDMNQIRLIQNTNAMQSQQQQQPINIMIGNGDGFGVLGKRTAGVRQPPIENTNETQADPNGDASAGHRPFKKS